MDNVFSYLRGFFHIGLFFLVFSLLFCFFFGLSPPNRAFLITFVPKVFILIDYI